MNVGRELHHLFLFAPQRAEMPHASVVPKSDAMLHHQFYSHFYHLHVEYSAVRKCSTRQIVMFRSRRRSQRIDVPCLHICELENGPVMNLKHRLIVLDRLHK